MLPSADCNERCATYDTGLHVCYDNIVTADYAGTTYKGFLENNEPVAVKVIRKCEENKPYFGLDCVQVTHAFNNSQAEHLVQYIRMEATDNLRLVVMEPYMSNLSGLQKKTFSKSERLKFIEDICQSTLDYHSGRSLTDIIINPNNAHIKKNPDGSYTAKLAGFNNTSEKQHNEWKSPAYLQAINLGDGNYEPSTADNIFSLGMLIYYIYTNGKHPFGSPSCQVHHIRHNEMTFDDCLEENFAFQNLMRAMTNYNPMKRPSIQQVINHPFFWSDEFNFHFIRAVYGCLGSFCHFQDNLESRFDIMNDFSGGWNNVLDPEWIAYLQTQRSVDRTLKPYTPRSFVSLLGFICDKFENRSDWATEAKLVPLLRNDERADAAIDELSYMRYFMRKFPKLILVLATTDGIESLPLNPDFKLPSCTIFNLGPSNEERGLMRKVLTE